MSDHQSHHHKMENPLKLWFNSATGVAQSECNKEAFRSFKQCEERNRYQKNYLECASAAESQMRSCLWSWGTKAPVEYCKRQSLLDTVKCEQNNKPGCLAVIKLDYDLCMASH